MSIYVIHLFIKIINWYHID